MSGGLPVPAIAGIVSGAVLALIGCGKVFPDCSLWICLFAFGVAGAGCFFLVAGTG